MSEVECFLKIDKNEDIEKKAIECVSKITKGRHSLSIPPQRDDYDMVIHRLAISHKELKSQLAKKDEIIKERDELIKEAMLWLIDELEDRKIIDHSNGVGIGAYQMKLGSWIEKAKKMVGEK